MAINISTTQVEVARFAGALYGLALDNATMTVVLNAVNANGANGLNTVLDNIYQSDFGAATNASVAATLTSNLGLTGTVATEAQTYITGVLAGTAANAKGAAVMNILNLFAGLTSDATFGTAATAWENKVSNAVTYSNSTANTSNSSMSAISTTQAGQTFALTTGIDTITGSNATVTATNSTITALDSIALTGTGNTLNITDTGAAANLPLLTVSGVQTLNYVGTTGLMSGSADVSGWTGLTQATVALTAPAVSQTLTAAGTTNVTLSEYSVAANNTTVQGGANVTVTEKGVTTGTITVGSSTAPKGTVTVTDNSSAATTSATGAINVTGGTTVSVTDNITNTAAATAGTTVTGGAITVTGTSGTTTSVSATQTAAVAATTPVAQVETITFTGGTSTAGGAITYVVNGTTYTATVAASATATAAATALAGAITASGITVTNPSAGVVVLTASTAGTAFTHGSLGGAGLAGYTDTDVATTANTVGVSGIADGAVSISDPNQGTTTASTITTATLDGYGAGSTVKS
ncbi:MAG: hypothetical protein KGL63_02315, partial [Betaproteobacteria bacterium]|nr:hypothetical protein [Betaproteobacteria bacterium]